MPILVTGAKPGISCVPAAVENAHLLEWACTVYWRAASIGTPRTLTETDLAAVMETVVRSGYGTTRPHDQEN